MTARIGADQIKVVLFCGGRGSASIIREFLRRPNIELTLLVNAYDDGLSTGALRKFIPGMLGPSDFRKNLSYLLDLHSDQQYALKDLIELRLPITFGPADEAALRDFAQTGNSEALEPRLRELVRKFTPPIIVNVRRYLGVFLSYRQESGGSFDFRDCSVGNLIFAGAYLEHGQSFNAAAREMSQLVNSQAVLVNVSTGENRILAAIKEDGQLLATEAEVVGPQSGVPIVETFFLADPISAEQWQQVADRSLPEKIAWLRQREAPIELSPEARSAIEKADIIVYGPGTQHSSLLPSYRIAADALRTSRARMKALIINLEADNDIQNWTGKALIDRVLHYTGDENNKSRTLTHAIINDPSSFPNAFPFTAGEDAVYPDCYRDAALISRKFYLGDKARVHNGYAVVAELLRILEDQGQAEYKPSLRIFVDLFNRSSATPALLEEFLEINWSEFSSVRLCLHRTPFEKRTLPPGVSIETTHYLGSFPEVSEVMSWFSQGDTDYLVTLTGDGEYRFRDIVTSIALLRDSLFGAVYGSRTQSRRQFYHSLKAAYGERHVLYWFSRIGAFLLTILFLMRFGIIFSDPLTGFRIYKRNKVQCLSQLRSSSWLTPASLSKNLIFNYVEIAELPVSYRTFKGFTESRWRLRRGVLNLIGLIN